MKAYTLSLILLFCATNSYSMQKEKQTSLHFSKLHELNNALFKINNTKDAQNLLAQGACIHARDGILNTPLHHAAIRGNVSLIEFFLENGANPNICNKYNESPLFQAIDKGQLDATKILIERGAYLNAYDNNNNAILHPAAASGNIDLVHYVVNQAIQKEILHLTIDKQNIHGQTPMHIAAQFNFVSMIDLLHTHNADLNLADVSGYTPLDSAIIEGHVKAVKRLIKHGANPDKKTTNKKELSPLHIAVKHKKSDIARLLIQCGAHINAQTKTSTPLCLAVECCEELIPLLLQHGAEPNLKHPLNIVIRNNNLALFQQLAAAGASLNNALNTSIECNAHEIATWLVQNKLVDITLRPRYGDAPLYTTVYKGNISMTYLLLDNGARLKPINVYLTALRNIQNEDTMIEMIDLLKNYGIDLTHAMSKQHHNTLLHIAAQRGFVKLARLQLFNGTLVQPNASGNLPHHVVPTYDENHDELVALLKPQSIFAPGKLVSNLIQWIKSPQLQINDTPMDQHEQALAILQDD